MNILIIIFITFSDSLFNLSQRETLANSTFTLDINYSRLTLVRHRFLSSANIINLNSSDYVTISLIYSKKSNGPSIEP